ncbi:CaiF/GrlA family transcriptional regulator [Salmonella enterica subsp. enterica]|nr:CaiF/GrlA family transcriptional regulator [Salmonella enterica subsp. enterica serovar Bonn]EBZ5939327.1 CaiF/GrlA family transcriptional regulator [Salmonella enterica subsp. enterica serovar Muenchen]MLZ41070.1 CaiF/GrlA family transcriptional regulator [Salmonella enterica subsp. enterica serovar Bonn]
MNDKHHRNARGYTLITSNQANHTSFFIPPELNGIEERTLYKNVAKWSLVTKKFICCDDVAEHFGISMRQATNIISIIHRRYGDTITCEIKRLKSTNGNVVKTHLLVTNISETFKIRKSRKNKKETCEMAESNNYRNMFLFGNSRDENKLSQA